MNNWTRWLRIVSIYPQTFKLEMKRGIVVSKRSKRHWRTLRRNYRILLHRVSTTREASVRLHRAHTRQWDLIISSAVMEVLTLMPTRRQLFQRIEWSLSTYPTSIVSNNKGQQVVPCLMCQTQSNSIGVHHRSAKSIHSWQWPSIWARSTGMDLGTTWALRKKNNSSLAKAQLAV